MIPISGKRVYAHLRETNNWTQQFLPNAAGWPSLTGPSEASESLLQSMEELPLSGRLGDRLEAWEMGRKIRRLIRQPGFGAETFFDADICQGNFHHHGALTRQALRDRLAQLGIESDLDFASQSSSSPVGGANARLMAAAVPLKDPATVRTSKATEGTEILLGQSYFLRFDPKLWEAMQPYPPLGTLYAASYLRHRGYRVALFDAMLAETEEEWAQALDAHRPEYAILYEDNFNYLSKMCLLRMREAAFQMTSMAKARGCIVIAGGADATDHSELYLNNGADYVLLGEGEETLGELMDSLTGRSPVAPETIIGLTSPKTPRASRRPDIRSLDDLPFPAWDLVDVDKYRRVLAGIAWLLFDEHGHDAGLSLSL